MLFQCEILRGVGARDNNFKPFASNDPSPSTISWGKGVGVTATSDGDILSFSGTSQGFGVIWNSPGPSGLSTTTYPYLVVRAKAANGGTLVVSIFNSGAPINLTFALTPNWQTITLTMPSGRTIIGAGMEFGNQSVAGTINFDYVAVCQKPPVQLAGTDFANGTVTRVGTGGVDHAQIRLNNRGGKYVTGSNAIGFGDHLHVYLGQAATLYHVYGGYVENVDPNMPADMVEVQSRGWGVALLQSLVLDQAANLTPQAWVNRVLDNSVNAANKNSLGIASNYQLSRSFAQNTGSTIGLYISNLKNAHDVLKEITDLTTAQGTPAVFFVDPAENLHFVPLGASGTANWTTDPIPATYPSTIVVGKDQITNRFRKDVTHLRNRVHYFGVAETPGIYDSWTESSSGWGTDLVSTNGTVTFSTVTSPVAVGTSSVKAHLVGSTIVQGFPISAVIRYPSGGGLGLDVNSLGSVSSPPLIDFYWRWHNTMNGGGAPFNHSLGPETIVFSSDNNNSANYFEYTLVAKDTDAASTSILNIANIANVQQDYWYHLLVPIGPHGGTLWANPPLPNTVSTPTYTGQSQYALSTVGSPSWANINYIGFRWRNNAGFSPETDDIYIDGLRVLGGRYILAYDNRATAYRDMREIHFFDPVAKDETSLRNFALAELLRLRNPILRGGFHTTLRADAVPEQQVLVTAPSANLSSSPLRVTQIVHRFSNRGAFTEFTVSDDFTNSQPIEPFKLTNAILQMGDNALFSREIYDLKTSVLDPSFTPVIIHP